MPTIQDSDITGLLSKKNYAPKGDAHELFCRSIMMRLGFEVGKIDMSASEYDMFLVVFKDFQSNPNEKHHIRVQVKTANPSIPLTSGQRGGKDRTYIKNNEKIKKISTDSTDLILAVHDTTLNLTLFPALLADLFGSSISPNKLPGLLNKWDILLNWNPVYLNDILNVVSTNQTNNAKILF